MSGRIELHRDDEKTPLATLPEQRFEVGRIYTVIVCGWVPAGTTGVQSVTIEDRFVSR